jgi:glycosyltransferase involved in cell wall biosynthesis
MPSYNNNARFRIEYTLNSVFHQNYSNYFVVIIDDKSTDGSDLTYRKYLDFWKPSKSSYVYVSNPERKTALENIDTICRQYCSEDSIGINLDGDD